jgi:hypothetical protein
MHKVIMKHKTIALAAAAFALVSLSTAQAQSFGYTNDDLLLNFRNTASITDNDLEVNLGPISTLAAFNGTEVVVAATVVQNVYGIPSPSLPIGFSAAAADASGTTGTLWLTRADSIPGTVPAISPAQQVYLVQNLVSARIANIGLGANAGTILAQGQAIVPGATTGNSYQAQAEQAAGQEAQLIVNFAGDENISPAKGGNIESVQSGSGAVYESLWEVPVSGTPDTYLGYFTFQPSGEVDYTSASVVSQAAPVLEIAPNGPDSVIISWVSAGNYTLQQTSGLSTSDGWSASGYAVSTSNGTNSVTISPVGGNQFFRLAN